MIYAGITVLTEDPNRRDDPTHTIARKKVRIDSATGAFTEIVKGQASRATRPFAWYMDSRAAIDAFRSFRDARRGRFAPVWVPTWHHDVQLVGNTTAGDGTITVHNTGYTRFLFDPVTTWRRHLAFIRIGSGVQFIRRIDAATESAATESLLLDAPITGALVAVEWMLSWLTLCRLNVDLVSLHWHGPTIAEASFDLIEIPQEMPLVPV